MTTTNKFSLGFKWLLAAAPILLLIAGCTEPASQDRTALDLGQAVKCDNERVTVVNVRRNVEPSFLENDYYIVADVAISTGTDPHTLEAGDFSVVTDDGHDSGPDYWEPKTNTYTPMEFGEEIPAHATVRGEVWFAVSIDRSILSGYIQYWKPMDTARWRYEQPV